MSSQLLDAALITSSRPVAHQEFGLGPRGSQLQELSTCDSAEVCHRQDLLSAFVLSKGLRCFLQLLADIFCSWCGFIATTTFFNGSGMFWGFFISNSFEEQEFQAWTAVSCRKIHFQFSAASIIRSILQHNMLFLIAA